MENKNKITDNKFLGILFTIIGIIGYLNQLFGIVIICILTAIITKYYLTITIIFIIFTAIEIFRQYYLKNKGYKLEIGQYKKE